MASNIESEYRRLIKNFNEGSATADDIQLLNDYYELFADPGSITDLMGKEAMTGFGHELKRKIDNRRGKKAAAVKPFYRRTWLQAAASLLIVCGALFTFYQLKEHAGTVKPLQTAAVSKPKVNRFIDLPDGSRVVLHVGSTLQVDPGFNRTNRTVTLVGEAYFDIKHDDHQKFIVRAGSITTTVLGTAFNIRAYPGQKKVIVTVTRGRVRVDKDGKLLAVLTRDKQLVALDGAKQSVDKVQATASLAWTRADMHFKAMPFGELATHMEERYGIHITFKNPALAGCPITGVFKGTESLTEMLDNLSLTRNTTYKANGKEVIIDGPDCN